MKTEKLLNDRGKTHGDWKYQAVTSQGLKKLMRECSSNFTNISPSHREALEMICVKMSRILNGKSELQHWEDIVGYAQLVVRELEKK